MRLSPRPTPPQPSSKLANGGLLAHVLLGAGLIDGLFAKPLSDSHSTELYRGDRIVSAITDALKAAGRPQPRRAATLDRSGRRRSGSPCGGHVCRHGRGSPPARPTGSCAAVIERVGGPAGQPVVAGRAVRVTSTSTCWPLRITVRVILSPTWCSRIAATSASELSTRSPLMPRRRHRPARRLRPRACPTRPTGRLRPPAASPRR